MSTYEINQILFSSIMALIIGAYAAISGWLMFKQPDKYTPFQNYLRSLLFNKPESSLFESNRKHGLARIAVGVLIIIGGVLQILGVLLL